MELTSERSLVAALSKDQFILSMEVLSHTNRMRRLSLLVKILQIFLVVRIVPTKGLASQDTVESFTDMLTNESSEKKTRGPTQMHKIWGNRDDVKIKITCNSFGQPHDENADKLSSFIGTIVRDGKNAPINYKNWHKEKFDIPLNAKTWTFRLFGKKLREWKCFLKNTYYLDHLSFEEQKKCKDKRVYSDQWEELIKYWATDNAKRKSAKNKSSRAKKEYNHTTGRKSFAQLRALQKPDGASTPTRATMFKICYAKKKKSVISEKTKEAMLQLQEKQQLNEDASKEKTMNDTFSEVMGREKHGSVRMYGFGVCPSDVWKDKSTWKRNQNEYVDVLEAKVDDLESEVQNLKTILNNQNNGNGASSLQVQAIHHSDKATSSHLDTNVNTALAKETRSQWFSSSQYDTPIIEVGELVNIKSVTSEPETIAIGIVCSNDPSKEVGGKKIGSSFFEVIVKVSIKPDEQLIKPYGLFKTIGQVVGASIAWPTAFLIPLASDKPFYDSMV
ncbi:uncharacterized protein LOC115715614 isoform X4 [Cannabis sativa]|uniref:uncharacterized protein LOC115715614 isoform X4 n=1 Tax=Cannabis sativa TaxID=3483 RepID=UPI0029C9EF46|nr:uncharacterized protein LOC115715614 isoform X4 [Cannabis sativa]